MNKTLKSIVSFKQVIGIEQQIQKEFMYEYLVDTPVSFFLFLFCSSAMLRNFIYILYTLSIVHAELLLYIVAMPTLLQRDNQLAGLHSCYA